MIRVTLPRVDAERLDREFARAADRKLRDRVQIVLMAHRGRKYQDIAADVGVNRRTVTRWVNAYLDGGLDALRPRAARGATPKIPAAMAEDITRWVIDGPAKQGLDRANWTHAELADHLLKTEGIRASRSAMQRFCSKIGIRVYRPTYRFLRGDPVKQTAARDELAALKKGRSPANS